MRWRSIFAGALGLAALQAVLSTDPATQRFAGLFGVVADVSRHFLSPFEPAIPDLRKDKGEPPPPPPPPTPPPTRPRVPQPPGDGPGNGVRA